jgi:hypothetical protein
MKIAYNLIRTKKTINYVIFGLIFTLFSLAAKAQENPPIPVQVQVNTAQFLNFGAFTTGNSVGTVIVASDGSRSSTGDVVLLSMGQPVSRALFDVTANPGTIITISSQLGIELTGSSGGSIFLAINSDSYSTGQTFITTASPPFTTPVYVGGTLSVGNLSANPPGQYDGTFTLTFIQQ